MKTGKNVALIGFMGVGKTTVSRQLARLSGMPEVDVDQWIVEKEGRPIPEIFETEGEQVFRDLETAALRELCGGNSIPGENCGSSGNPDLGGNCGSGGKSDPDEKAGSGAAGGIILSCGGGAVLRRENVEILKENGVIVLLTAEPETVLLRVGDGSSRPVLGGVVTAAHIAELMEKRQAAYEEAADVTVATDGRMPEEIAEEILRIVEART